MVVFAEKRSQVCRQGIDKLLPLIGITLALKPIQVGIEAIVARFTQTPRQTAIHHGMFAIVQANACVFID